MDDAADRLAAEVVARMKQIKRSRRQVSLKKGPKEPTMLKIERGQATALLPDTLRKLNVGLDWEPGSAERVYYQGGHPTPKRGRGDIAVGPPGVVVPAETIGRLIAVAQEIATLAESEAQAMRSASARLDAAIQPLYARYVTQLLEANRRQGGALGPLVAILGPFLDRPIDEHDDDAEEALYRRFLAGMPVGIDDATRMRFQARLEAST